MKKKDKMYPYRILSPLLCFLIKLYYHPKVIGKENIPKEGSILIVGNHIHLYDQFLAIMATKRPVHYMAKKEYFDGKFAWFFKMGGCISVDRSKKDDKAVSSALEVLNNDWALGLFPEGTRNSLKEERIKELFEKYIKDLSYEEFYKKIKQNKTSQINYLEELLTRNVISNDDFLKNMYDADYYLRKLVSSNKITEEDYNEHILLPFKFGAVSMAKKTDSYLIPFGISGDYKFRSKNLTIQFGKPFKTTENLEEDNKKLEKEVRNIIIKNKNNEK